MQWTNRFFGWCRLLLAALVINQAAVGQDIYVYPASGQTQEQLSQDRYSCHLWAVKESGFDPSHVVKLEQSGTVKVPVSPGKAEGATVKGTIAGAVTGGMIGAPNSNATEGAVIGAVVGTIAGAVIEGQGQQEAREQAQAEAQHAANANAQARAELAARQANYRRALTACLEGRHYTVGFHLPLPIGSDKQGTVVGQYSRIVRWNVSQV